MGWEKGRVGGRARVEGLGGGRKIVVGEGQED